MVWFYWYSFTKIQHTSFGLLAPYMSSKALVSSALHGPEVAIFVQPQSNVDGINLDSFLKKKTLLSDSVDGP